jgi:hypothetical protein
MRIIVLGVAMFAVLAAAPCARAQKKELLVKEWGSLSGKVTLDGKLPDPKDLDLTKRMMAHLDKACCLAKAAKPEEKVDTTWLIDPKTKGVANVVVWIIPPKGMYFPLPTGYKPNKEPIVIDQPHCTFIPRVSAYNPVNIIDGKPVATGQTVVFKNSSIASHNIHATGSSECEGNSFNVNLASKGELKKVLEPQFLPININCDIHTWMAGRLFVFDHPYYAITKADGTYEVPQVPAGAEVSLMVYHEGPALVLPELKKGRPVTLNAGKNTMDFDVKSPFGK